jgi:hypothetical protein
MKSRVYSAELGAFGVRVIGLESEELGRRVWGFHYDSGNHYLRCTAFHIEERPTRQHGFKIKDSWSWYDNRKSTLEGPEKSDAAASAALKAFRDRITLTFRKVSRDETKT